MVSLDDQIQSSGQKYINWKWDKENWKEVGIPVDGETLQGTQYLLPVDFSLCILV